MKYIVAIFAFCISTSASAQLLKTEPIKLPLSLSLLEYPSFQDHLNYINDLKTDIKPYKLTNDELDRIRRGNFIISTKSLNKNYTFTNPPIIDLKKELRKVMLVIPGTNGGVGPRGFTL